MPNQPRRDQPQQDPADLAVSHRDTKTDKNQTNHKMNPQTETPKTTITKSTQTLNKQQNVQGLLPINENSNNKCSTNVRNKHKQTQQM